MATTSPPPGLQSLSHSAPFSNLPGFQIRLLGYGISFRTVLAYCQNIGRDKYTMGGADGRDYQMPEDDYQSLVEIMVDHIRQQLSFEPHLLQARLGLVTDGAGESTTIMVMTFAVAYRAESEPLLDSDWDYLRDEVAGKVLRERIEAFMGLKLQAVDFRDWPTWWAGDGYSIESESEAAGGLDIVKKL
ncbi:hypothetical protein GY45DRAFT_1315189 [Cubamyces sp. BRFM 1775]|nr:hypothetical protein GY45DRAFT_1315189 [Cubamyces sp. BRFM 1775]